MFNLSQPSLQKESPLTIFPFLKGDENITSLLSRASPSQHLEIMIYFLNKNRHHFFQQSWDQYQPKLHKKEKFSLLLKILGSGFPDLSRLNLLSRLDQDREKIQDYYQDRKITNFPLTGIKFLDQDIEIGLPYRLMGSEDNPLSLAIGQKRIDVIKYFLERIPDIFSQSNFLIRRGCVAGDLKILKILLEKFTVSKIDLSQGLVQACFHGCSSIVRFLLADHRVDPGFDDDLPLISACESGKVEVVRLLLSDSRINPATQNQTPLIKAAQLGRSKVVQLLLTDSRVNPAIRNQTPLIKAAQYCQYQVIQILLRHPKVNPSVRRSQILIYLSEDKEPLHHQEQFKTIRQILRDSRVDPCATQRKVGNFTRPTNRPLFAAINNYNLELVQLLFSNPRFRISSNQFQEAIEIAYRISLSPYHYPSIYQFLKKQPKPRT